MIALIWLRELSPNLRDQLMVTLRDRALIEAKAKGIDIEAALRHPFRQLLKVDVVVSALAVSLMLMIYYTAVGFSVIYLSSMFGLSTKDANGLGNWNWGFNVIAVILIGVISDRFKVRKPFMVVGGAAAAVMTIIYLLQAGLQPSYYTLAIILALLSFSLGVAYTPWMASFTETVEAHNPALTATGLAIWGWIIRIVVFLTFLLLPTVINSVTPLVDYGSTVAAYNAKYPGFAFAAANPAVVATAQKYSVQLGNAQKFQPELTALQKDHDERRHRVPQLRDAEQGPEGGNGRRHRLRGRRRDWPGRPVDDVRERGCHRRRHQGADRSFSLSRRSRSS